MPNHIALVTNTTGVSTLAQRNLMDRFHALLTGVGFPTSFTRPLVGNGTILYFEGTSTTVTETWTITCTSAAANSGTFSVVGSVTGATASATVGTAYDNGKVKFLIQDGTTDFIVGDFWTVAMSAPHSTASATLWETQRWYSGGDPANNNQRQMILKGKGLSGTEEIYVGAYEYYSVGSDYYNMVVAVSTGYVPGNSFNTQPGVAENAICAHNTAIDYWLSWNAQKIAICLKVGGATYESAYLGKFYPYTPPSQYPYPVVCSGMLNGAAAVRYSSTATTHGMGYKGNTDRFDVRSPGGVWEQPYTFPWIEDSLSLNNTESNSTSQIRDTNGYYPLTPVMILSDNGIYGELDGIYHVSGFSNAVENTMTVGGSSYVLFGDRTLTGFVDYYAMRLD